MHTPFPDRRRIKPQKHTTGCKYFIARGGNVVGMFLTFAVRFRHLKSLRVRGVWCEYLQVVKAEPSQPAGRQWRCSLWGQVWTRVRRGKQFNNGAIRSTGRGATG